MTAHQDALIDLAKPARPDDVFTIGPDDELRIVAHGKPQSQGNLIKGRWGGVYEKDKDHQVQTWREAVKAAAQLAMTARDPDGHLPLHPAGTPVQVTITFTFDRGVGHFGTGRNAHTVKESAPRWPATGKDLDKLIRAALDSLAAAGVVKDDKQVVALAAAKTYPGRLPDALDIPGAVIRVRGL